MAFTVTAGMKKFTVNILPSTAETMVSGGQYKIYASQTTGFTPSDANLINTGPETSFTYEVTAATVGTWYVRVAGADCFYDSSVDTLIYSEEVSVVVPLVVYTDIGSVNADTIIVGSIRGINVQAASHMTKGTYLTSTCAAADATLYVKDTIDFASGGGTAYIIDSTNDRDTITYTGITSTTLTGVSGVLAHTVSSTSIPVIIPASKSIVIADVVNEMRFYGDRGDGTIEELINIGLKLDTDYYIVDIGSSTNKNRPLRVTVSPTSTSTAISASSGGNAIVGISSGQYYGVTGQGGSSGTGGGILGTSSSGEGISGISSSYYGVIGTSVSSYGLYGYSASGNALYLGTNATKGNMNLAPCEYNALPTDVTAGQIQLVHKAAWTGLYRLCYSDGTNWRLIGDDSIVS